MAKKKKAGDDDAAPKKSKKKLLIIMIVVLVVGGAGYKVMGSKGAKGAKPVPVAGAVVKLDSININLAGGHYLKLGIAIQATAAAGDTPPEGSEVLDAAINLFTDQTMAELSTQGVRDKAKAKLEAVAEKAYPNDVMGIYYTEFVMQ